LLITIFNPQLGDIKEKNKYHLSLLDEKLIEIIIFNNFDKAKN